MGQEKTKYSIQPKQRLKKMRYTIHLPVELVERARNAAWWTPGVTMSRMAADGIEAELARIEKVHNRGQEHPGREGDLGGRPIGS